MNVKFVVWSTAHYRPVSFNKIINYESVTPGTPPELIEYLKSFYYKKYYGRIEISIGETVGELLNVIIL